MESTSRHDAARPPAATTYRERLAPGPAALTGAICFGLSFGLIPLIISVVWGVLVGLVLGTAFGLALWFGSPVVQVAGGELVAGRAHIPASLLGEPAALDVAGLKAQMGPGSDARTFACVRPWVRTAVRADVLDPQDPTPAWLVASRHPDGLVEALQAAGASQRAVTA